MPQLWLNHWLFVRSPMRFVELLNAISANGAAVLAIVAGVALSLLPNASANGPATALIAGGFALLQHNRGVSS
jgi:hypothetical protein